MADFSFAGSGSVIDCPIHYKPSANTTAEGDIKSWIISDTRAGHCFTQSGDIGIIVDEHWGIRHGFKPSPQIELRPSLNLMRAAYFAATPIDGPAKTYTYGCQLIIGHKLG